jgi:hypothetical protein
MNVSPNALLRMVADGQLDVAFVHEVEGSRLRVPEGLRIRVLVEREPQFVYLASDHPATVHPVVDVRELAGDRWMIDPTVDGEWDAVQQMFRGAGINPHVLHGDYHSAAALVATGEVVTVCQPTAISHSDMVVRRLLGDPLGVRLLLAARTETDLDGALPSLEEAYWESARQAPAYREWLERTGASAEAAPALH